VQIDAKGELEAQASVGSGQTVQFYGAGGTLRLDEAQLITAKISGFAQGDFIDLRNVAFGSSTTVSYSRNTAGGTLTVSDGVHTLKLVGNYAAASFAESADGFNATMITYKPSSAAARN
jgi:hypothetical protein